MKRISPWPGKIAGTLLLVGALLLEPGCTPRPPREPGSPVRGRATVLPPLKIGVAVGRAEVTLRSMGGGRVIWSGAAAVLPPGGEVVFEAGVDGAIVLCRGADRRVLAAEASFLPEGGSTFLLDGRPYGGTLDIFHDGKALIVLNRVGMEEYLRGVVPWEIGFLDEEKIEAVKCQAVAARTYAWSRVRESGELWDLLADESDQVYRGLEKTSDVVDRAIEETADVVAVWRGQLIRAYYSSTCGGRTAPLEEVWFDREPAPYLRGVVDGPGRRFDPDRAFCRGSPRFLWKVEWSGG